MALPLRSTLITQRKQQEQALQFIGFPLGINREISASQLETGELVTAQNFKYTDDGKLVTRQGLRKVTTKGTNSAAAIKAISSATVSQEGVPFDTYLFDAVTFGGGEFASFNSLIVADENYYLYYLDGDDLTQIDTKAAEGTPVLVPFSGSMIIMDGSYMKYWNGNLFRICYDDGDGTDGYQMDDTDEPNDGSKSLYNGATVRYGSAFTTQAWSSGYTIPITQVTVVLSKSGSPTGNAVVKLYKSDRTTAYATSANFDVSTLTTDAVATDITFSPDSTYQMAPETTYFVSVEYSGGDAGNYLKVHYDTLASGYTDYYYDGSWHAGTARVLFAVKPGRPPKASFGCVWMNRLWFVDPDEPGLAKFTNANSYFDFSTTDGAGYIGALDNNAQNFPIGSLAPQYGSLFLFGRKEAPYVARIGGTTPEEFYQTQMLQSIYAEYESMAWAPNDIWFANETGVYNVKGVQEYGDVRMGEPGAPITSTLETYFTSAAFGAYNPIDGQYLLKLAGYTKVLVAHLRCPAQIGAITRYPWTEYLFNGVTPSAFGFVSGTFYVGGSDGHLYALDADVLDNAAQPVYELKTCVLEHPFTNFWAKQYFLSAGSAASASIALDFYRNGGATSSLTKTITVAGDREQGWLAFPCRSIQLDINTLVITKPLTFGGVIIKGVPLEARHG